MSISVTSGAQSYITPTLLWKMQYVFCVNAVLYGSVSSTLMGESSGNYQLQSQSRTWIIEKTLTLQALVCGRHSNTYSDSAFVYDGTPKTVKAGYVQGAASDNDYKVSGDILSLFIKQYRRKRRRICRHRSAPSSPSRLRINARRPKRQRRQEMGYQQQNGCTGLAGGQLFGLV